MRNAAGLPYPPYLWLVVRQSVLVWLLARPDSALEAAMQLLIH